MHLRTRSRAILLVAPAALVLAAAAACGSSSPSSTTTSNAPGVTSTGSGANAGGAALKVTDNQSLGQIVINGTGMTVYRYDADTNNPSKSNCTGGCASAWPPLLESGSAKPSLSGVSAGSVGEISRPDGTKQVTLDGWPLYTYAGDSGAGATSGQGSGGTWWAVTPTGAKAGSAGSGSSSPSTGSGGSGGYNY
jgi:predicted lipoprotein with Yx(FWY)xxD motif